MYLPDSGTLCRYTRLPLSLGEAPSIVTRGHLSRYARFSPSRECCRGAFYLDFHPL